MKKLPKGYKIEPASDRYWDSYLMKEIEGSDTIVAMIICHDIGQWEMGVRDDEFYLGATQEDLIEQYLEKQDAK
jgi:hypothetical protein